MLERDRNTSIFELRTLTEEEIALIRTYDYLTGVIDMLDNFEEETGERVEWVEAFEPYLENTETNVRLDYTPQTRGMLLGVRGRIADVAFQQGFALHMAVKQQREEMSGER